MRYQIDLFVQTLVTLNLGGNCMDAEGVGYVVDALRINQVS